VAILRRSRLSPQLRNSLTSLVATVAAVVFWLLPNQSPGEAPQDSPPTADEETPAFKLRVERNLVPVRVVVRDGRGRAVGGLRKEDFKVFNDGKLQSISHFSVEVAATPVTTEANPASRTETPPSVSAQQPDWRYVGLYFDDIGSSFEDLARGRNAADGYLTAALASGDRLGVFSASGLVTADFTGDRDKLHEALFRLRPNQLDGSAEYKSHVLLQNMEGLVRRMSILPGQRAVILISTGHFCLCNLNLQSLERSIVDRALRSDVVIGALDPKGLPVLLRETNASWEPPPGMESAAEIGLMHLDDSYLQQTIWRMLARFTEDTGGELFHNDNDLAAGFVKVTTPPPVYYSLAFSPKDFKFDGSLHTLKVEIVHHRGLTVSARRGYFAPRKLPVTPSPVDEQIETAAFSLDELKGLPVDVHTEYMPTTQGGAQLLAHVHLDIHGLRFREEQDRSAGELMFVAVLFDRDGNYVDGKWKRLTLRLTEVTRERLLESGIDEDFMFHVEPGTYFVRAVVQDSEERRLAALNSVLEVPLEPCHSMYGDN